MEISRFAPLEPGIYFIDPDGDPSTPLRVTYKVAANGWQQWIGAAKYDGTGGYVGVSITTVPNVVRHGCRNSRPAAPPVGPGVDDLADALAELAPFRVTSPPGNVRAYGYSGKHLELTVPSRLRGIVSRFPVCTGGELRSWIAPIFRTRTAVTRGPATPKSYGFWA